MCPRVHVRMCVNEQTPLLFGGHSIPVFSSAVCIPFYILEVFLVCSHMPSGASTSSTDAAASATAATAAESMQPFFLAPFFPKIIPVLNILCVLAHIGPLALPTPPQILLPQPLPPLQQRPCPF